MTLWRGDLLLGGLRPRPESTELVVPLRPKPPTLSAFLLREPDASALDGIWQIVWPPEAGVGVQQHAIEPDIVATRAQRYATRKNNAGPVELQPMSPEAVAGVPAGAQLTVRGEDGAVYLPRQIRLEEVRFESAQYAAALREIPHEALVDGSVWCVFIAFASDADAPVGLRPQFARPAVAAARLLFY